MRNRLVRVAVGAAILGAIVTPAILWSGKQTTDAATREATAKLPEISTVGTEMQPYVLTPAEREKLKLPAFWSPSTSDFPHEAKRGVIVRSEGPYPGMTPAELEKLAACQARGWDGTLSSAPKTIHELPGPVPTFGNVPRAPGIEGMTPAERAKLEAYANEGGRK